MEFQRFTGKTVDDAVTNATVHFGVASSELEIEVIEKGSSGFLGIGSKAAVVNARRKSSMEDRIQKFLGDVCHAMNIDVEIVTTFDEEEKVYMVELKGNEMGVLIGKRGQTLDSLQYLTNLAVNHNQEEFLKVKLDTENYRQRRKETLENLARNISFKVKKTHRPVSLEPMNPYERRIIHAALQEDSYVLTHSEGEEPYRHVVIVPKRERSNYRGRRDNRGYNSRGGYRRGGYQNKFEDKEPRGSYNSKPKESLNEETKNVEVEVSTENNVKPETTIEE